MTPPDPIQSRTLQSKSLLWLLVIMTVLFCVVVWPLFGAVAWAVFMAIVFASAQERMVRLCRGRAGWAAAFTLMVIVVSVLLPMALLAVSVVHEATAFYARLSSGEIGIAQYLQHGIDALPAWAHTALERWGVADLAAMQRKFVVALGASAQALTAHAFTIGQNTLEFVVELFVMLYLLFFLLRDGKSLSVQAERALPLEPEHTRHLLTQFATVVRATVKGNVLVALVQGALGWLAFWVLDISGALLWGTVMALLSLLPAVGAALVWGPVALYLLITGDAVPALGLAAWGVLVIGLVDNLLRPILVGKDTRLPDYLVLIATLGGMAVFGLSGFVVGPVIAALFITAWDIFARSRKGL